MITSLVMDGKYLATVSTSREDIKIFRANDGVLKASFFIHGLVKTMGVASDDRTLVIGTHDGRVMMMTILLELLLMDITLKFKELSEQVIRVLQGTMILISMFYMIQKMVLRVRCSHMFRGLDLTCC